MAFRECLIFYQYKYLKNKKVRKIAKENISEQYLVLFSWKPSTALFVFLNSVGEKFFAWGP